VHLHLFCLQMATAPALTGHRGSPSVYRPQARFSCCSSSIEGKQYTYGGHFGIARIGQPPRVVEILSFTKERWQQLVTRGQPPPGFMYAACASIGVSLYTFGGRDGVNYFNCIYQLHTPSLAWSELKAINPENVPMAKASSAMVSFGDRNLVTVGGFGILPANRRSGVEYVVKPDVYGDQQGLTNEVAVFCVDTSKFLSKSCDKHSSTFHTFSVCTCMEGLWAEIFLLIRCYMQ